MLNYRITGLQVASDFPFPPATSNAVADDRSPDVVVRLCENVGSPSDTTFRNDWIEAGESDFVFSPQAGLSIRILQGKEVRISRTAEVSDNDIALFLLGSAWGVLCHQRGLLPLHCSAIAMSGTAFAFTGPSGAGKSTLAAGLAKRGHRHICDDVCVIDFSEPGTPLHPIPKGLKLWGDAADALGLERGRPVSSNPDLDKYYVAVDDDGTDASLQIRALYVLDEADSDEPEIRRLRGSDHLLCLYASVYRSEWLGFIRDPGDVFRQTAALSGRLRLFKFSRPRDMQHFQRGLSAIEQHMNELANEMSEPGIAGHE